MAEQPESYNSYTDRPLRTVVMEHYIVGYMDILGFKNMLKTRSFSLINILFEEIAEAIYFLRRQYYISGLHVIEPRVVNFSDSIVLYQKLRPQKSDDDERINGLTFSVFQVMIRDTIATSLKLKIPIRGGVAIGEFYEGSAMPTVPNKVWREQLVWEPLLNAFQEEYESPDIVRNKILQPSNIQVHFGQASTDAYLLESSINSIGVFMKAETRNNPYIKRMADLKIGIDQIIEVNINGESLLAFNWATD